MLKLERPISKHSLLAALMAYAAPEMGAQAQGDAVSGKQRGAVLPLQRENPGSEAVAVARPQAEAQRAQEESDRAKAGEFVPIERAAADGGFS